MAKGRKPAIGGLARPEGFVDDVIIRTAKKVGKAIPRSKAVSAVRKKMGKSYYVDFGDFGKAKVSYSDSIRKPKKK